MENYTLTDDLLYKNFIKSKPRISEATKKAYYYVFTKFCNANNNTLQGIIETCKEQQNRVIEKIISHGTDEEGNQIIEKRITKFDVNKPDVYINICLDNFINYCRNKGNRNISINSNLEVIGILMKFYDIEMPEINKLPDDSVPWNPLTKEDIKFIMADSTLTHETLIGTLKSSGIRLRDAVDMTINDFMKGTKEYHDYVNVEEFIDNAPQDMICTLKFLPNKTKRFNLECITFIDPETCNKILQNLRRIKNEYLPKVNKQYDLNLKLSKDDALFGNQRHYFKGHNTQHNISDLFNKKNKKLREHRISLIEQQIKEGLLSEEDYEEELAKIPKFHAHGLRKFFISTIAKNCGNLRICAILEGHTPPIKTDQSYVDIDVQEIKEAYMVAIPDLSLENTEVKVYTSEIRREMEQKISSLEEEVKIKEAETKDMKDRLSNIEKRLSDMDKETNSRKSILETISQK